MRRLLISTIVLFAMVATASASDRYPVKKRYVNQSGQVVTIGQTPQISAYAEVPVRRALPDVQIVPVAEAPQIVKPQPRLVTAVKTKRASLFGPVNVDPKDWPSGRKCCVSGQPYFNEEPNS